MQKPGDKQGRVSQQSFILFSPAIGELHHMSKKKIGLCGPFDHFLGGNGDLEGTPFLPIPISKGRLGAGTIAVQMRQGYLLGKMGS